MGKTTPTTTRKARGPSADTPARQAAFLDALAEGDGVRAALAASGVAWGTVRHWIATHEDFAAQYERARAGLADWWADRAGELLDEAAAQVGDDSAVVSIAKARSDYAKWRAGVSDRKRYGEKQVIEQDTTLRVVVEYAQPDANRGALPPGGET